MKKFVLLTITTLGLIFFVPGSTRADDVIVRVPPGSYYGPHTEEWRAERWRERQWRRHRAWREHQWRRHYYDDYGD